jgi:hypothetical protein
LSANTYASSRYTCRERGPGCSKCNSGCCHPAPRFGSLRIPFGVSKLLIPGDFMCRRAVALRRLAQILPSVFGMVV